MNPRFARAALAVALLAAPAAAIGQDVLDWQPELNTRLLRDRGCKVMFYSGVVDRVLEGGKRLIIAKAHCEDKRAFDAIRNSDYEAFQIKECQPTPTAC